MERASSVIPDLPYYAYYPGGTGRASGFEKWGFELTNECGRSVLVVFMQSPKHTGGLAGAFYVAGFVTPPRGASTRQGNC